MASTTFVNNATLIVADWLNDVNAATYTTIPAIQTDVTAVENSVTTLTSTVQNSSSVTLSSVLGTDSISASATPTLTAYGVGQTFRFVAAGANAGAVTINIDSVGTKSITKQGNVALEAGDIISGSVVQITYDGTQFQLVSSAGAGGGATGAGGDQVFYENDQTVTTDYTLTTGKNAMSAGPITINTGITVTVPSGQTWTVV